MKIYTKTGDDGDTGLFGGPRVRKNHPRIEAYGSVDELNSVLGLLRCEPMTVDLDRLLERVQHELFDLGAELASPDPDKLGTRIIDATHIAALELAIDAAEAALPPLRQFILPGGTRTAALLHVARTVCRRAERACVGLAEVTTVHDRPLIYLNRLSDLLFVLARRVNLQAGQADIPWRPERERTI